MATLSNSLIPDWVPDPSVAAWADQQGFGPATPMSDKSLRALAKTRSGKPAGLYLWEGEAHEMYVGISSTSVVSRLRQHVKNYDEANIQSFRYMPETANTETLRAAERELIYDLSRNGFTCFNREHSAVIYGTSVLDELVSVEEQKAWFNSPAEANLADLRAGAEQAILGGKSAEVRSRARFEKLSSHPEFESILEAIATYLRGCVLFPRRTQGQFWSLSCLPSLRMGGGVKRLVTLNIGMLEVFFVNELPGGRLEVGVATDTTVLPARMTWLALKHRGASMAGPLHKSSAPNAEYLFFKSPTAFVKAMRKSDKIRSAAARYSLDRTRRGRVSGRYADAHNGLLAGAAIDRAAGTSLPTVGLRDALRADDE
ncbi:GIY-YIG nuclease family protein [Dietzia kunjamensis]|uniref:GIY-YIG nuclease family protein n=1 Tax=Dietzia kunjamensis TaxID=322509 RepID=UPI00388E4070